MKHKVSDTIPRELLPRAEAAVAWFNDSSVADGTTFSVTGILDAETALSGSDELKLILCGDNRCEQRSFRVIESDGQWTIEFSENIGKRADSPQAELDPPPGVRLGWLDSVLSQHAFVVLLFYRGFW